MCVCVCVCIYVPWNSDDRHLSTLRIKALSKLYIKVWFLAHQKKNLAVHCNDQSVSAVQGNCMGESVSVMFDLHIYFTGSAATCVHNCKCRHSHSPYGFGLEWSVNCVIVAVLIWPLYFLCAPKKSSMHRMNFCGLKVHLQQKSTKDFSTLCAQCFTTRKCVEYIDKFKYCIISVAGGRMIRAAIHVYCWWSNKSVMILPMK